MLHIALEIHQAALQLIIRPIVAKSPPQLVKPPPGGPNACPDRSRPLAIVAPGYHLPRLKRQMETMIIFSDVELPGKRKSKSGLW